MRARGPDAGARPALVVCVDDSGHRRFWRWRPSRKRNASFGRVNDAISGTGHLGQVGQFGKVGKFGQKFVRALSNANESGPK